MNIDMDKWDFGYLWQQLDNFVRADVIVLGLLLAHTIVVVMRIWRCCYQIRKKQNENTAAEIRVRVYLKAQLGTLRSIVIAAPYLGLVGACLGIVNAFSASAMAKHAFMVLVCTRLIAALVPTTAGVFVAIAARFAMAYGQMHLGALERQLPTKRFRQRSRVSPVPAFAVILAPTLTILLIGFMTFGSFHVSKGFAVRATPTLCDIAGDRMIVLRTSKTGGIYLNHEEERDWKTLRIRLSEIYRLRKHRMIYLVANGEVPYQTVVEAVDSVASTADPVTSSPLRITVSLVTESAMCSEPLLTIPVHRADR